MKSSIRVASAPAKVILFGEHFVVYGAPALLAAINRHTTARAKTISQERTIIKSDIGASAEYSDSGCKIVRGGKGAKEILDPVYDAIKRTTEAHGKKTGLRVELRSKIPHGIGLGSSAASCVATVGAVDSLFGSHSKNWICDRAIESERIVHKNSSGADCYISTFGGIMRYSMNEGYRKIEAKKRLHLVVSSTGIRHSTGDLVEQVRKFREANPSRFNELSKQAHNICTNALEAIELGQIENLGRLMSQNHLLLNQIGVSHEKTEALVKLNLGDGALGAKITGAGGGGAVIALASSRKEGARVVASAKKAGYSAMLVEIDHEGLTS